MRRRALYWARQRLRQYRRGTVVHVYEALLDEVTLVADPNCDCIQSSVMAVRGQFGRRGATFTTEDINQVLADRSGEDPFVDGMLAD